MSGTITPHKKKISNTREASIAKNDLLDMSTSMETTKGGYFFTVHLPTSGMNLINKEHINSKDKVYPFSGWQGQGHKISYPKYSELKIAHTSMNKSYQKKYLTKPSPDNTPNGFPYQPCLFPKKSVMGNSFQSNKSPPLDITVSGHNIYGKKPKNFPENINFCSQIDASPNQTSDLVDLRGGERGSNHILNISTPVVGEQLRVVQ